MHKNPKRDQALQPCTQTQSYCCTAALKLWLMLQNWDGWQRSPRFLFFFLFFIFNDSNINKRHNEWGGAAPWQWRLLSSCLPSGPLQGRSTAVTCGAATLPCGEIVSFPSFLSPSSPCASWKLGTTPKSMRLIQKNPLNSSFISFFPFSFFFFF